MHNLTLEATFDLSLPQSSELFFVDAVASLRLKRTQQHIPLKAARLRHEGARF